MKHPTPALKGARRMTDNKTLRLKRAAVLSRSKTANEIKTELGISTRTLKRYMADPRWQEYGGIQLTLTERGRPTRDTLSETEKQTLTEAYRLHNQGRTWIEVAEELEMTFEQLRHLRRKDTNERDSGSLTPAERETLQQAQELRDTGMKWKDIPAEIGISYKRLEYLRSKQKKTETA